jgi:methionine synthase I (cobalamin-dependent)
MIDWKTLLIGAKVIQFKLDSEDPFKFANETVALRRGFGLKGPGECCGTDERHIKAIALRMDT